MKPYLAFLIATTLAAPALAADPHLRDGLNVKAGRITHPAVRQVMDAA